MKISVNTHNIYLPTGLFMNRLTGGIIRRKLKKCGIILTGEQVKLIIRDLKRFKKTHTSWTLVQVDSKDGAKVEVKI